jgi:hypothetical protein
MELLHNPITMIIIGILLVTLNDAIGSVISRKLNFNYGFFTIGSVAIYCYVAYSVMKKTNYMAFAFLSVLLIAFYDATIGWKISLKLKANFGQQGELMSKCLWKSEYVE